MAMGCIVINRVTIIAAYCMSSICLFLSPGAVSAADVGLAGIMGSRALVIINGGSPRPMAVGQLSDGVRVVAIQGEQVIVEADGKKLPLRVGQNATFTGGPGGGDKVVLTATNGGHFFTSGAINGVNVRFVVDTGASMISMGAADAARIGVDWSRGERGVASTANGQTVVTRVKLGTVQVGGVTEHNVDALVHQTNMPAILLGMSFLNRMDMQTEGSTMTLKKRY